ncbi:MAG: butyrate kinase [Bacteroidales bacterium]|nr:butyrate kinase [Bacteroidales bacterium]
MRDKILVINNGSTSTKIALFISGKKILEQNLGVDPQMAAKYKSVMDRREDSRNAILNFLHERDVDLKDIEVVMARGGLISPVNSGVYAVNEAMIRDLQLGKDGVHACNLSAIIADDIARHVNSLRREDGLPETCAAYIADPPQANDLLPEYRLSGRPELTRRSAYHALNSRAVIRAYARNVGRTPEDIVAIVAHIGGGSSVSLHYHGKVIDVNDSLGGDGPISVERAGTVPAFPIIDICFSGKYTKEEVQKMLVGNGGAMSYFGTKDMNQLVQRAQNGDKAVELFLDAYCASVAKYIGYFSTDVCGKLDVIIITGGVAYSSYITDRIAERVSFIAPVKVYPGEDEIQSLAENGFAILAGTANVQTYCPVEENPDDDADTEEFYKELTYVSPAEEGGSEAEAAEESDQTTEAEAETNPGRQLRTMLRRQLRRLAVKSQISNAKTTAASVKLRRILTASYRGDPLWRLFKRPSATDQAQDAAADSTADTKE